MKRVTLHLGGDGFNVHSYCVNLSSSQPGVNIP